MSKAEEYLKKLRHSTAHLLAAAVLELYPKAKLAIGPSTLDGFYYDIDFGKDSISEKDLPKIEKKMRELVHSWKSFKRNMLNAADAKKHYGKNPYKNELIDEFSESGKKKVGFYESVGSHSKVYNDQYSDLCKGGHIKNPSDEIKYFKLLKIAGAYWRGDEKNPMLTRIYGTAFASKQDLESYLKNIEEAEKRDHKKLGPSLELFMFHKTAPGMPYWLPKGVVLYNELVSFWREDHKKRGYKEIVSPVLNKKELFVTSGHYDHYWDEMYVARGKDDADEYGVKAMNCPNAHVVFASKTRSYRNLPLRLSDTDSLHRYERSGTLNGLFRVRQFRQDDAHIYVSENLIESEYQNVLEIVEKFYGIFGIAYSFRLGTRDPKNFMGDVKTWNKAEKILKKILKDSGVDYYIEEGDGAFYGPKVDILMKDALGRKWQMGTIQLDFQQPARFKLKYTDKDGSEKTPIAIHRVIYGSLERFIGILIEHFAGAFPVWLSPIQVKVIPIADRNIPYAEKIVEKLEKNSVRVEINDNSETLSKKIRNAQNEKVPYMIVVGDKEEKEAKIALRLRSGKDLGQITLNKLIKIINKAIETKALDL